MTTSTDAASQPSLFFPDASTLDLLIPDSSDFDVEVCLKSDSQLVSRDNLLFEELLPVYVILRSSLASFQQVLRDVEIYITAHATQPSPPPRLQSNSAPAPPQQPVKLTLDSVTISPENKPILIHLSDNDNRSCAVWKTTLYLRYPPQKLHRPSIHLTASAVSRAVEAPVISKNASQDEYMTSALPTSENLLQSLQHSSQTTSDQPCIPSSRIHKVAPRASPATQDARPLRTSSRLFPVFSALAVKVHITPEQVSDMLLCLDLESARHTGHGGVQVIEIKAEGNNLNVQPFSSDLAALGLPTTLQTGDRSTFLYKLAREKDATGALSHHPSKPSNVTFQIRAVAQISETCRAQIQARWHGNVNFPSSQPTKRMSLRPQSVASTLAPQDLASSRPLSKRMSSTITRPLSGTTQIESAGVTFAFTAPERVNEGETFHLDVFVVNRSPRRKRLAIVATPKPAKANTAHHTLRFPNIARQDSHHTAEAVLDDRTIYNMQDQREARMAEVVCLNADVRVGPLPPGACHNVQLEFLTLSTGLVGLAAVHVVDLDTRETTQITELPDIMVAKK
ncbi:hypothetical protein D6C98_03803 [Aureobasidium pullulans]|nr:hypothetical protein D6D03_05890 [Aureobasidium pullulans]THY56406.1 hypothetical protein D6C98_03803 [Aureobasidium pullulans]